MNKELVALAKEDPFKFTGWLSKELIHNSHEPLRYYFWLCELQQWIEEKYFYFITSYNIYYFNDKRYYLHSVFNLNDDSSKILFKLIKYESKQESLEDALLQLLIHIKENGY